MSFSSFTPSNGFHGVLSTLVCEPLPAGAASWEGSVFVNTSCSFCFVNRSCIRLFVKGGLLFSLLFLFFLLLLLLSFLFCWEEGLYLSFTEFFALLLLVDFLSSSQSTFFASSSSVAMLVNSRFLPFSLNSSLRFEDTVPLPSGLPLQFSPGPAFFLVMVSSFVKRKPSKKKDSFLFCQNETNQEFGKFRLLSKGSQARFGKVSSFVKRKQSQQKREGPFGQRKTQVV